MLRRYIICAPSFNADNGGSLFLHGLADALNDLGQSALIWPMPPIRRRTLRTRARQMFQKAPFHLSGHPESRIARRRDIMRDAIVVYPEVVLGNPLGAPNVARWLLYKPGLRNPYRFGEREIFFAGSEACDLPEVTGGAPRLFLWQRNPVYRNEQRPDREGACFLVRKGDGKTRVPQTERATRIDGLDHSRIAEIFNQCETFYSYDEASMYSLYAAICGCVSIVIPGRFDGHADYVAQRPIARFGVSYGFDEIDHAIATQDRVSSNLDELTAEGMATVRSFIDGTQAAFPLRKGA